MNQWIVVASRADAQVFKRHWGSPLELVASFHNPSGRRTDKELIDRGGRGSRHFGGLSVNSPMAGESFFQEESPRRFAKQICTFLEKQRQTQAFDSLVLVAAPRFLGHLKKSLTPSLHKMVARIESKDLAAIPEFKLKRMLREMSEPESLSLASL